MHLQILFSLSFGFGACENFAGLRMGASAGELQLTRDCSGCGGFQWVVAVAAVGALCKSAELGNG